MQTQPEASRRFFRGCDVEDLPKAGRAPIPCDEFGIVSIRRCPWASPHADAAYRSLELYARAADPDFPRLPFPGTLAEQPLWVGQILDIVSRETNDVRTRIAEQAAKRSTPPPTGLPPKGAFGKTR